MQVATSFEIGPEVELESRNADDAQIVGASFVCPNVGPAARARRYPHPREGRLGRRAAAPRPEPRFSGLQAGLNA